MFMLMKAIVAVIVITFALIRISEALQGDLYGKKSTNS